MSPVCDPELWRDYISHQAWECLGSPAEKCCWESYVWSTLVSPRGPESKPDAQEANHDCANESEDTAKAYREAVTSRCSLQSVSDGGKVQLRSRL